MRISDLRGLTDSTKAQWAAVRHKCWQIGHYLRHSPSVERWRVKRLARNVELVCGPAAPRLLPHELLAICVVRNGRVYIRSFMEHYQNLGVKHVLFLDTGSTDGTVDLIRGYSNATVLRTSIPYKNNEFAMKRFLLERFGRNRWSLFVDIDEHFDYPYSDRLELRSLLTYLDRHNYTAVVGQMLDMFSDASLAKLTDEQGKLLKELYQYYDISCVQKLRYDSYEYADWLLDGVVRKSAREKFFNNSVSNPRICFHMGGVRYALFGTRNYLTKCPLIKFDGEMNPAFLGNGHLISNARIADFSCVVLHYRFTSVFLKAVLEDVKKDIYNCDDYKRYYRVLKSNRDIEFKTPASVRFSTTEELIDSGLLVVSEDYATWCSVPAAAGRPASADG